MNKAIIAIMVILSAYVIGFIVLLAILMSGISLPSLAKTVADWIYAPLLFIVDRIFGGMC